MLVTYSVSFGPALDSTRLLSELQLSLWSLRQHNRRVPIIVFVHSPPPAALGQICRDYGARPVMQGSYAGRLAALCPEGWPVLARHPTLHKFLNFGEISGVKRVLLCDCDTLFRGDVERLFAAYSTADVYGREEVHSGSSLYGPNQDFLDELGLQRLAASLGVAFVPPFNSGVVLVNHGRSADLRRLNRWFVDCVWHFMVWMSSHPQHTAGSGYGVLDGISAAWQLASPEQRARALPYPSANQWIVEEVAIWLALGALPGLTTGHFSPADVPQNGELGDPDLAPDDWLLCHYFSTDPTTALTWLRARQPATSERNWNGQRHRAQAHHQEDRP